MCDKGPVNLEDRSDITMRNKKEFESKTSHLGSALQFEISLYFQIQQNEQK